MPNVISPDGTIRQDNWVVVSRPAEGESLDIPADQPALIPADLWLAGYEHFTGRQDIGVWFQHWPFAAGTLWLRERIACHRRRAIGSAAVHEALRIRCLCAEGRQGHHQGAKVPEFLQPGLPGRHRHRHASLPPSGLLI